MSINLFHIPAYQIDTSKFNHLLHGGVVMGFEEAIAQYTGAKYAVSFSSATSAIELIFKYLHPNLEVSAPSIIPHVVGNALYHAGKKIIFEDDTEWVGRPYLFGTESKNMIVDSAHAVDKGMASGMDNPYDMIILSHFPTKPCGGIDGGTILFNDSDNAEFLRELSMNGEKLGVSSWERKFHFKGHKCYMNSSQAYVAWLSLNRLDKKKDRLNAVREQYNQVFNLSNTSDHLYRVKVINNRGFVEQAKLSGITCGIHYDALHLHPLFATGQSLPLSEEAARTMVSIPFHEMLTKQEIEKVVEFTKPYLIQ